MIIDAGPALNFFATNNERLLLNVVGPLRTPETVRDEILDKSRSDRRFRPAEGVWMKLAKTKWLTVLSDDATEELEAAVARLAQTPMAERMREARDLGELMVVAHAAVLAESGEHVSILIDDGNGATLADNERRRIERLGARGQPVGSIKLYNSIAVMTAAAKQRHIPDRGEMRKVYDQLRACDDGLVGISQTGLLSADVWK